jgi:hypothetical protein
MPGCEQRPDIVLDDDARRFQPRNRPPAVDLRVDLCDAFAQVRAQHLFTRHLSHDGQTTNAEFFRVLRDQVGRIDRHLEPPPPPSVAITVAKLTGHARLG